MTWTRHDDQRPINRKMAGLSDAAYRLDDEAIGWCSRNLTNGLIPAGDLATVSKRGTPKNAAELVARGRWHRATDERCPSEYCAEPGPDGWVIHDYLEFNPSKERVLDERKRKTARQQRWREKHRGSGGTSASTPPSTKASRSASRRQPVDALETPAPSRPAPKEGGAGPRSGRRSPPAAKRVGAGRENQPPVAAAETHRGAAEPPALPVDEARRLARLAAVQAARRPPTQPAAAVPGQRNGDGPDPTEPAPGPRCPRCKALLTDGACVPCGWRPAEPGETPGELDPGADDPGAIPPIEVSR